MVAQKMKNLLIFSVFQLKRRPVERPFCLPALLSDHIIHVEVVINNMFVASRGAAV